MLVDFTSRGAEVDFSLSHASVNKIDMQQVTTILADLQQKGIMLSLDGGKLKVKAPKGAMTAETKHAIQSNRDQLIALIREATSTQVDVEKSKILARSADEPPAASYNQIRLLNLTELDPKTGRYNIPSTFEIKGDLQFDLLQQSLEAVVHAHPILRTTFQKRDGVYRLTILDEITVDLPCFDFRPERNNAEDLRSAITSVIRQPFDLSAGPLFRFNLFQIGQDRYRLLAVMHHNIFDGWSANLFWAEVSANYDALVNGKPLPQPENDLDYFDYAVWHWDWLNGDSKGKERQFWEETLTGDLQPVQLPGMLGTALGQDGVGELITFDLPESMIKKAKALAQSMRLTPFAIFNAAYAVALQRYSAQKNILICTPVAGRTDAALEKMIGYFNNVVVLNVEIDESQPFKELLMASRDMVLASMKHQTLPFQEVAELPNLKRVPLARAFFSMEGAYDDSQLKLSGLDVQKVALDEYTADFDWSMFLRENGDGYLGELWYKREKYDREIIGEFVVNFQAILSALLDNPELEIGALPRFMDETLVTVKAEREHVSAQGGTEETLKAIWEQVLELDDIGVTESFFDLGGHSMLAVRLFAEIEKGFAGQRLPLAALLHAPTIRQLAKILDTEDGEMEWSLVVPIQTEGSKPPLFMIHGAGGNILLYRDLAKYLKDADQPVYGIQSQGLDGLKPLHTTVEEMAAAYIEEIRALQPEGPYLLGGYCLGGTIALEMAQQLNEMGQEVAFLALLETYNWIYEAEPNLSNKIVYNSQKILFHWRNFAMLDGREKMTFVQEKFKVLTDRTSVWYGSIKSKMNGGTEDSSASTVADDDKLLARVWENNDTVAYSYVPKPYNGTISHFKPQQDYALYTDPKLGWDEIALQGVITHQMPIYPAGMLVEPFVSKLADTMYTSIDHALETIQSDPQPVLAPT